MRLLIAILLCTTLSFARSKPIVEIKVSIEASDSDRRVLLEKLNHHGKGCHWHFTDVKEAFDYRIVFVTDQPSGPWWWGNTDRARATIYDVKGTEISRITRSKRKEVYATDSTADEIIEQIQKWQKQHPPGTLP